LPLLAPAPHASSLVKSRDAINIISLQDGNSAFREQLIHIGLSNVNTYISVSFLSDKDWHAIHLLNFVYGSIWPVVYSFRMVGEGI